MSFRKQASKVKNAGSVVLVSCPNSAAGDSAGLGEGSYPRLDLAQEAEPISPASLPRLALSIEQQAKVAL